MKKLILFAFAFMFCSACYSQAYLGVTKYSGVKLLKEADVNSNLIKKLESGTQLFIYTIDTGNDFYKVIEIESDIEGYVDKENVRVVQEIERNTEGIFTPVEKSDNYNAAIEIFNNTEKTLTLKLNESRFTFNPYEKRTIEISPGIYDYFASAPLVLPNYGTEKLENNYIYSWEFYIIEGY